MINRRILLKDALVLPNAVTSAGALRGTALTRTGVARSWQLVLANSTPPGDEQQQVRGFN